MKKLIYILFFLLFAQELRAQQGVEYSQFMLNNYGLNPAVAGVGKDWQIMLGRRTQWRGFANAPESNFAGVTKDLGKKGYRRYWHGVGVYVEQDRYGMFDNKSAYATYAIHLKVTPRYKLSFGLNAGIRQITVNNFIIDENDPAFQNISNGKLLLYPEFIPGLYFYSNKITLGFSVRDLYKNKLQEGHKKFGSPAKISPTYYMTFSKKIFSPNADFNFVPAVLVQSTFTSIPLVNLNIMAYYRKRVGLGITYRIHDALSAMIQVRLWDNLVVGFAYDYTISKFRAAESNSTEIMMGFTPVMSSDSYQSKANVAQCPKFEY